MKSGVNTSEFKTLLDKHIKDLFLKDQSLSGNVVVESFSYHNSPYYDKHGRLVGGGKSYEDVIVAKASDILGCELKQKNIAEKCINFVDGNESVNNLYNYLGSIAFPAELESHKINLWSGALGAKKACLSPGVSTQKVPAFTLLYAVLDALEECSIRRVSEIESARAKLMRDFASRARGVVSVYISSDKASERAGFTTQNFFWDEELPVLQELKRKGRVSDIQIHLYDHEKNQWKAPASLFKSGANSISIRSRLIHRFDDPQQSDRFKKSQMTAEEKKHWQNSAARPEISLGQMRSIARSWKDLAIFNPKSPIESYWNDLMKKWAKFEEAFKYDFDLKTTHIREKIAAEHFSGEKYKGYQFTAKEFWESSYLAEEERKNYLKCFADGVTAKHMHQGNASKKMKLYYALEGIARLSKEVIQSYVKGLLNKHQIHTEFDAISQILTKFIELGQQLEVNVNERKRTCWTYLFEEKMNGSLPYQYIDQLNLQEKQALLKIVQMLSLHPLDPKAETETHPLDHSLRHLRAKPVLKEFQDEPADYHDSASAFSKITNYIGGSINASRRTTSFFGSNSSHHSKPSAHTLPKFGYERYDDI